MAVKYVSLVALRYVVTLYDLIVNSIQKPPEKSLDDAGSSKYGVLSVMILTDRGTFYVTSSIRSPDPFHSEIDLTHCSIHAALSANCKLSVHINRHHRTAVVVTLTANLYPQNTNHVWRLRLCIPTGQIPKDH